MLVEVRQSFLVVPLEITFDDCRHGIPEYGLHPILGQAWFAVRLTIIGLRRGVIGRRTLCSLTREPRRVFLEKLAMDGVLDGSV